MRATTGFHALYRVEDDLAECSQHCLRGCDPTDAFPVPIFSSASRLAVGFFRLHVHRNPRVFCCTVNMTSLWNLDLRFFADGCEIVIYKHFHVVFLTDHPGFIVNISFIHSFISVLKMTASETNFGMTKKHVFHCVSDLAH